MVNLLQKYVADLLTGNTCYMYPEKVKSGEIKAYEDIPLIIEFSECLKSIAGAVPNKDCIIYILYLSHYPWFNTQALRAKPQNVKLWKSIVQQWSGIRKKKKLQKKRGKRQKKWSGIREEKKMHIGDENDDKTRGVQLDKLLIDTIHNNKQLEDLIRTDLTRIKYPIAQSAIMDTIACVFKLSPRLITENHRILATIDNALNGSNDILDFTEKEKQICYTPEGELCTFEDDHKITFGG
eukprot:UN00187